MTLLLLTTPALAQPAPGEWVVSKDARYTLTWSYSLEERTSHSDEGDGFTHETRKVSAELHALEGFRGEGFLQLTLRKVEWTLDTRAYTLKLVREEGEEPALEQKLHDDALEPTAEQLADEMRDVVQREYRLRVRRGEASIQVKSGGHWAGGADAPSVFDRCYVQSDLPSEGKLKSGRKWIDPRESEYLPLYHQVGKTEEIPKVKLRLQLGKGGLSVKGSGKAGFKGRTLLNWSYAGKSSVKRSFSYSAQGILAESAEEASSTVKRKNMTKPGRSSGALSIKQTLQLAPQE